MKNWISKVWKATAGRRTYLVAGAIAAVTLVLVATHQLTTLRAFEILLFGGSALGASFRKALKNHQAEAMALLEGAALFGAAVASRQVPAALEQASVVVESGRQLVEEVTAECEGAAK